MPSKAHNLKVRVKTARGRKNSSTRWLQRQLNDPYVKEAKQLGYRARSAFKLKELDDKYHFLKKGGKVVDLGCAPGGWSQVAVQQVGIETPPLVVGLDLLPVEPLEGASFIQLDFLDDKAPSLLKERLQGKADIILSDMAPNTTGLHTVDCLRLMNLLENAYCFAKEVLKPDGIFIAKVFQGGVEASFLQTLKQDFQKVTHFKPDSSRKESSEFYIVARGFRCI